MSKITHAALATTPHFQGHPSSWLWNVPINGQDIPRIVIDKDYVAGMIKEQRFPERDEIRAQTKLILHETALVLHWRFVRDAEYGQQQEGQVIAEHERQAWIFAAATIGYSIGEIAFATRRSNLHETGMLFF